MRLTEEPLDEPYVKDYDDLGGCPMSWPDRFDVGDWLLLLAFDGDNHVGGAAAVCRCPDVQMLDSRSDLAVLWDIRVHPDYRRSAVGPAGEIPPSPQGPGRTPRLL